MNPIPDAAARDEVMRRVRTGVRNPLLTADRRALPAAVVAEVPGTAELVAEWRREFEALNGRVYGPLAPAAAGEQVVALLRARDARRVLTWDDAAMPVPDLHPRLAAAGIEAVMQPPVWTDQSLAEADAFTVGVTGSIAGLANTGSIVLASGPGRARSASLVPPVLVAFLRVDDIVPSLSAWLHGRGSQALHDAANVVVITGPSRTADIELTLVIGVHGPGEIHVILVG